MPPIVAGALVFLASAAVLVLEILAVRMMAPYVGISLETYTGVIGILTGSVVITSTKTFPKRYVVNLKFPGQPGHAGQAAREGAVPAELVACSATRRTPAAPNRGARGVQRAADRGRRLRRAG